MSTPSGPHRLQIWAGKRLRRVVDKFDRRPVMIGIVGTVIALAILIGVAISLENNREGRIESTLDRAQSAATVVATSLGGNIAVYDTLLKDMVRDAENPATPLFTDRVRDRVRFGQMLSRDFLDDAYVVDKSGKIAAPLHPDSDRLVDVSDRDYFRSHLGNPSLGLYISQPYASRVHGGLLSVALTRRVNAPDHSFAGVAVIALRLDHFQNLVTEVESIDVKTIQIVEDKGTVLACAPCGDALPGTVVRLPGNATRDGDLLTALSFPAGARAHDYRSVRVPGASLYVVITPLTTGTMREWRWNVATFGSIALACAATLIAGSWLLVAAIRMRTTAMTRLASLSVTDGLTGLSNRRALDSKLALEWRRAQRSGTSLSVLFIDVDYFKHFNDEYGHAVGDDVLRAVAHNIAGHMRRDADMAARFGGEEFAVVMPDTPAAGAAKMAEQIRRDIERLQIAHTGSAMGTVTVSVGAATGLAAESESGEAILRAADEQLYLAKQAGRNCTRATVLKA
ncbi:GGDEF domain-containing protein [Pandoraea norimbergensis]|uniref:diguanylate cyclase n=1 Tax=Pandoraea norimbergensis TaxID=93219 RepID=A0ABN4JK29_9BURK|nr:diguanylate cyclase [Pandoraea norimbergensis]ALS61288.1 hypothetical protein AT302_17415 [Pandoraea norimbergensis]